MNRLTEPECIRKCAAVVNLSAPNATGTMLEMQYSQMKCTYINRFFAITVGMNCRYSPRNILLSTMTLIEILLFWLDFAKSGLINGALLCKAVTVLCLMSFFFGESFLVSILVVQLKLIVIHRQKSLANIFGIADWHNITCLAASVAYCSCSCLTIKEKSTEC